MAVQRQSYPRLTAVSLPLVRLNCPNGLSVTLSIVRLPRLFHLVNPAREITAAAPLTLIRLRYIRLG